MNAPTPSDPKHVVPAAVQANKEHQYALKVYTDRLETELKHLDKLLAAAEVSEDEEDEEQMSSGGGVVIPGAVRARGPISVSECLDEVSPFYDDAIRRQTYQEFIESHPMRVQELDALTEAVHSENYRLHALEAQARGLPPFMPGAGQPVLDFTSNKEGIDWERVAQKVTQASTTVQRSAKECEIRWLGERHPQFNNSQWTQSEIAKVKQLVAMADEGEVDWVEIAKKLGTGRTPVDCLRNAIVRKTHSWTPEADKRLLKAVDIYGTGSWGLVARTVSEDATAAQCQNRYTRTLDPELSRGPWTAEEDEQLRRAVDVFGKTWIDVCQYVSGRNSEQCRDRYQEYLNPTLTRGKWMPEQDVALLQAVEQAGEGKWREVSRILNIGRTDNMCRTRYNVITKRKAQVAASSPDPEDRSDSRESSQAPSTSKRLPPRRAVPSNMGNILILHPGSYQPRTSTSTHIETPSPALEAAIDSPGPSSGPASSNATLRPKSKPKPRRKQAPVTEDSYVPTTPVTTINTPTTQTREMLHQPTDQHPVPAGSKRPASTDAEGSHASKRPRREEPIAVAQHEHVAGSALGQESNFPATSSRDEDDAAEVDVPDAALVVRGSDGEGLKAINENAPGDSVPTRGRGSGRGRGRGTARGRGRGRARGRPTGRQGKQAQDTFEGTFNPPDDVTNAGASVGPAASRKEAPTPSRKQPPRAAHRSQASTSAQGMDIDS